MEIKQAMDILGLNNAEDADVIKSMWRQKVKENQPLSYAKYGEEAVSQAIERLELINEAYEFITVYKDLFGSSDFIFDDSTDYDEDVFEDVWIEDEVFDGTFTDSLTSILIGFDHPDSNFIRNIKKYSINEIYDYYVSYSYGEVDPRVKIGDKVDLFFDKEFKFLSYGKDRYEIIKSSGIEEDDRADNDYFDESILFYIRAGFVKCMQMTVASLSPFSVKIVCSNNVDNIKGALNKVKKAIKATYIQTLMAYKDIYKPETKEIDGYIIHKNVYVDDIEKTSYTLEDINRILGSNIHIQQEQKSVMFYHYSSRMKYYHGHLGVLDYNISIEKAREIFSCTYIFDKVINSSNFAQFLSSIGIEKVYVKKLNDVTAVTTIKVKRAKNGNVSYGFDTIFYDN